MSQNLPVHVRTGYQARPAHPAAQVNCLSLSPLIGLCDGPMARRLEFGRFPGHVLP